MQAETTQTPRGPCLPWLPSASRRTQNYYICIWLA